MSFELLLAIYGSGIFLSFPLMWLLSLNTDDGETVLFTAILWPFFLIMGIIVAALWMEEKFKTWRTK
jgi:hypothetical protein